MTRGLRHHTAALVTLIWLLGCVAVAAAVQTSPRRAPNPCGSLCDPNAVYYQLQGGRPTCWLSYGSGRPPADLRTLPTCAPPPGLAGR